MYPPAQRDGARTIGHECEEFHIDEIDALVQNLAGLPVWVEHDEERLVGQVLSARKTHAGAVEVEAVVKASTASGKKAIDDILEKKMVGRARM